MLLTDIDEKCSVLAQLFNEISQGRKQILEKIAGEIQIKVRENKDINLMYVCTHNARRSHFGQIWSAVAAAYYKVPNVKTFSGGVEVTSFHPSAIKALESIGFQINKISDGENPFYEVYYNDAAPLLCFSKEVTHEVNAQDEFIAIMVCGEAEQNCPFIPSASMRISTTYEDPKKYDDTPVELFEYVKSSLLIGLECLYLYSFINKGLSNFS
ncbi:MAG: protein-tyrosine-phosphatase [Bacteroidetes bacterium]|nr:protein-tyrosine-phosphatase [Bacteroidota bacterium]